MEALTTTALTMDVLRNAAHSPAVSGEMTKAHQCLYLVGHIQARAHDATVQPLPTGQTLTLTDDTAAVVLVTLKGIRGRITHHLAPATYNAQTGTWEADGHHAAGGNYATGGHYLAAQVIEAITGTAYPALPVHDRRP